ncbi:MAG: dethiobiotin synthase [Bacteroidales bacterium]|nr:dethiobiotin synthase [Bacteroidales bacterium]MCD8395368.1 dethiobiotin synthase [Bacteroidales bacterium]
MSGKKIFISGIDTDAGKSYCTGYIARKMMDEGLKVITLKPVQTGCSEWAEDILTHRRIMGIPMQPRDLDHTTAPIIFSYPASPHLAAEKDGGRIDLEVIDRAADALAEEYDVVLIEGAGGLMVPLTRDLLTIDYVAQRGWPVMLVTNARLGSINHTLLSLEALTARNIPVHSVVYNEYFDTDPVIAPDTREYIATYVSTYYPMAKLLFVPAVNK